ncbi:hypothetical protein ACOME3_007405 [Neoechinorhynchus agilis]
MIHFGRFLFISHFLLEELAAIRCTPQVSYPLTVGSSFETHIEKFVSSCDFMNFTLKNVVSLMYTSVASCSLAIFLLEEPATISCTPQVSYPLTPCSSFETHIEKFVSSCDFMNSTSENVSQYSQTFADR